MVKMNRISINEINFIKKTMRESPLVLKRIDYREIFHDNNKLLDADNNFNPIGTKGDMYAKIIMDHIIQNGRLGHNPRLHY